MTIGNILGKVNSSNSSFSQGIWTLNEQAELNKSNLWQNFVYDNITVIASAQIQVTGNNTTTLSLQKISGSNSWDAHAYSLTPYTAPVTMEYRKPNPASTDNGVSYSMISWNTDPTTDASYSSLDYASYPYRTSLYEVYHNNSQVLANGPAWNPANTFYMTYLPSGVINHYNGSTLLYTINRGNQTVYFDSSFYSPNVSGIFTNIRIIRRVWDGTKYI